MYWQKTFEVAGIKVLVESDAVTCLESLQAVTKLYHEIEACSDVDVTFSIRVDGDCLSLVLNDEKVLWTCLDARDIPPALEIHIYYQVLERTYPTYLALHAACVRFGDIACVFAGISGAGKSSICTAALLTGASYFTDEFTLVGASGDVYPFPRPLQWDEVTHPAFSHQSMLASGAFSQYALNFVDATTHQISTSNYWLPENIQTNSVPLKAFVLPEYGAHYPNAMITPLRRSEVLMALPEHVHIHFPDSSDIHQANQRIPKDCKFYRVQFSDVHEAWKLVAETLSSI